MDPSIPDNRVTDSRVPSERQAHLADEILELLNVLCWDILRLNYLQLGRICFKNKKNFEMTVNNNNWPSCE